MKLSNFQINHPNISFTNELEAVPATRKTQGNVTIHNEGQAGQPAYFEANFWLSADHVEGPIKCSNYFSLKSVVLGQPIDAPYETISDLGAAKLPAILRAMADEIEAVFESAENGDAPKETS